MKFRALFYDDVAIFGGHEEMTLNALQWMAAGGDFEIGFVYSPGNVRLESRLKELASRSSCLELLPSSYTTRSLQFMRTPWALQACGRICSIMRGFKPDCVVVVQGEISLSSLGLWAARRESIPAISYIPLAQSRRERGGSRLAWLKDMLLLRYYQLPNAYITISESVAEMLRLRGARQPVRVVENGIDLDALETRHKPEARRQLGLPAQTYLAALVGRIECKQKGQDILLRALADHREQFEGWKFLIVGDGPDKSAMTAMAEDYDLGDLVEFLPWQDDKVMLYSAIDLVVIPSRFEGVPVVMLEAMYCRLPLVASDRDAMTELLPQNWLFATGDTHSLGARLIEARHRDDTPLLERNRQLVLERFTSLQHGKEFSAAVRGLSLLSQTGGLEAA